MNPIAHRPLESGVHKLVALHQGLPCELRGDHYGAKVVAVSDFVDHFHLCAGEPLPNELCNLFRSHAAHA